MPLAVNLEILSGSGLGVNANSAPFCTVRFRKNKYRTKTQPQSANPMWNERLKLGFFSEEDDVEVTCWDRERMGSNDVLGYFRISLMEFSLPFMVGEHKKTYPLKARPGHKDTGVKGTIDVNVIIKDKSKKDKKKSWKTSALRLDNLPSIRPKRGTVLVPNSAAGGAPEGELEDKATVKKKLTSFFKFRPGTREELEDRLSGSGVLPADSGNVFGAKLDKVMANQKLSHPDLKIPVFVHRVIEALYANPLTFSEQGLFRISGSAFTTQKVRAQVDSGKEPELSICSRDDLASLLKEYIRELPEPLFTIALYHEWVKVYDVPQEEVVPALRALVRKLPLNNRHLWKAVNKFLYDLSKNAEVNMMSPQNIGIVIGPNVLWEPPICMPVMEMNDVVCHLVEHYEQIWAPGPEDEEPEDNKEPGASPVKETAPSSSPKDESLPADPSEWSVSNVAQWLDLKGFSQYAPTFIDHSVDGNGLFRLSADNLLTDFAIASLGHRKKILFRIRDLAQALGRQTM